MSDESAAEKKSEPSNRVTLGPMGEPFTERPIPRSKTAALLAKIIVWTFAISIGLCFIGAGFQLVRSGADMKAGMDPVFDLFKTVSAVLSGPLGFVLGYYFRERSE